MWMISSLQELRLIAGCKESLASEFKMKDIGRMHYFLGLEVWQEPKHIFLGQGRYVVHILRRFRMCYRTICTCLNPQASGCKISVTGSDLSLSP
jgi:hypothetical protein